MSTDQHSGAGGHEPFGRLLRRRRVAAGLTQEQLADLARLSVRAIRDLERGATGRPYRHSIDKLATALGLTGADLAEFTRASRRTSSNGVQPSSRPSTPPNDQTPRQLPPMTTDFTGRAAELKTLGGLLDRQHHHGGDQPAGTMLVSAIGGTAGVGKTALAVHWAHQIAPRFPDGQLYINLRGYDPGQPMPPADALAAFLRALGVPGPDIPADTSERAARYRSLLAGRRILVLLDNAASAEQVRPLLPASPACLTLVTSRDTLAGLVARDGARRLDLDLLSPADATILLTTLIGDRAAADPAATTALATACARLPLALRVAAELATTRPDTPLPTLVTELANEQQRLDLLDADGDRYTAIRAVFSWSYQHLNPHTAHTFRLLSLHPGPHFEAHATAALTATTVAQAQQLLDTLTRANLIHATAPGRCGLHDLLRDYGRELSTSHDSQDEQHAALTRLFDHYLHTAATAMDTLYWPERDWRPRIPQPATPDPPVTEAAEARDWLDTQRTNLISIAAHTAGNGWPGHTTRLAATLNRYFASYHPEAVIIHGHARLAAHRIGDRAAEATALTNLGIVDYEQCRYQQATDRLQLALTLSRETGDRTGQARALGNLGLIAIEQGRYQQATGIFQRTLTLFRETGARIGQARSLHNLGRIEQRLGHHEQATDLHRQALALFREIGDQRYEAMTLATLGVLDLRLSRYQQATGQQQQSRVLHQQAAGHYRQALALFREVGFPVGEAEALNGLGDVLLAAGRPADARTQHAAALDVASRIANTYNQAHAHKGLGHAWHTLGDTGQARRHWREAQALYTQLSAPEAAEVMACLAALGPDPPVQADPEQTNPVQVDPVQVDPVQADSEQAE